MVFVWRGEFPGNCLLTLPLVHSPYHGLSFMLSSTYSTNLFRINETITNSLTLHWYDSQLLPWVMDLMGVLTLSSRSRPESQTSCHILKAVIIDNNIYVNFYTQMEVNRGRRPRKVNDQHYRRRMDLKGISITEGRLTEDGT